MLRISASYNNCNPNFVIQNIEEPTEWNNPIFAILKNIFMRGCPTLPSLLLRENFGDLKYEKDPSYYIDYDYTDWNTVIRGGSDSNPALDFYNNILPKSFSVAKSFIPECNLSDIFTNSNKLSQVDFYSPLYNIAIEIDGKQHKENAQQIKDRDRDSLFAQNGIDLIRIPTYLLKDEKAVFERFRSILNDKKNALNSISKSVKKIIPQKDIPYALAIRLQTLLLYLYAAEEIAFDTTKVDLCVTLDFDIKKEDITLIIDDFYLWLENIAALQNKKFNKPIINVIFCDSSEITKYNNCVKIDVSLTKAYSCTGSSEVFYIRNDYFRYKNNPHSNNKDHIYKNYFTPACCSVKYNITQEHEKNLEFILKNASLDYPGFRPKQLDIIIDGLNKRGVLGILPTSSGKSLGYQLVSLLVPAMTIVIAPLKVLMIDQYDHLCENWGITNSIFIDSDHPKNLDFFKNSQSLVTVISPERLFIPSFKDEIIKNLKNKIGFIVIDEAHCLSEWGHDFRTSYLCLSHNLKEFFPSDAFFMALTGTASHAVFKDIQNEFLNFKKEIGVVFAEDMRRTNLTVLIRRFSGEENSTERIFEELKNNIFATLVGEDNSKTLVFTKKKNKRKLEKNNVSACIPLREELIDIAKKHNDENPGNRIAFFAGENEKQTKADRDKVLKDFKEDTSLKILLATKAFGMGVDIKDIRKTIHFGLPSSMEGLYQQIGRAGRDGNPSECYVYFREESQDDYNFFLNNDKITIEEISEKQNQLKELDTTFYFIQNSNIDVETEKRAVLSVYEYITIQNYHNIHELSCDEICSELKKVANAHLTQVLSGDEKTILVEKILYRLFLLGEIEMWDVVYGKDLNNPTYTNVQTTTYSEDKKFRILVEYIRRYESRVESLPKSPNLEDRLEKLLRWTYDNFLLERIKSMKTLYDWCKDFTDSNNFMGKMASYFSNDPVYARLIDSAIDVKNMLFALNQNPKDTKLRIARLLESYEKIDSLNFISGITRLRLNEFPEFDGERRLKMSFEGVRGIPEQQRLLLFAETYKLLEDDQKEVFVDSWLQNITEDAIWIYKHTQNTKAEKYLLADFTDKLMNIKEKIDAKL